MSFSLAKERSISSYNVTNKSGVECIITHVYLVNENNNNSTGRDKSHLFIQGVHEPTFDLHGKVSDMYLSLSLTYRRTLICLLDSMLHVHGTGQFISRKYAHSIRPQNELPVSSGRVSPGDDGLPDLTVLHTQLDFCCRV